MRYGVERLTLIAAALGFLLAGDRVASVHAQQQQQSAAVAWQYSADVLRPFWQGRVVDGESVLFVRDASTGVA